MSVGDFIGQELVWVLIVGNQFEVTIKLIDHTTFLHRKSWLFNVKAISSKIYTTMFDEIGWCFTDDWDLEEGSETKDKDFLDEHSNISHSVEVYFQSFIAIKILLAVTGNASV